MNCHDYKEGEHYYCKTCKFEIMIVKTCQDCCGEHDHAECDCQMECCGKPLIKKE